MSTFKQIGDGRYREVGNLKRRFLRTPLSEAQFTSKMRRPLTMQASRVLEN